MKLIHCRCKDSPDMDPSETREGTRTILFFCFFITNILASILHSNWMFIIVHHRTGCLVMLEKIAEIVPQFWL
ncbi:hypothetical protein LguiA_022792 [Lonicera macranthoides]